VVSRTSPGGTQKIHTHSFCSLFGANSKNKLKINYNIYNTNTKQQINFRQTLPNLSQYKNILIYKSQQDAHVTEFI
jgi:hypothetical protein